MVVKVFAKLNLTLNVGENKDGFHQIDSVVTSVNLCDKVCVKRRMDDKVTVWGCEGISQEQNVAYKAARAFQNAFGTGGCDVQIRKGIPIAAGLGGSSADAAAVVHCLCKLCGVQKNSVEVHNLCAQLGSDVNFMLRGGLARMRGKGDDLIFEKSVKVFFAVTFFEAQLSAKQVYDRFDILGEKSVFADNKTFLRLLQSGKSAEALRLCSNGLQLAANSLDSFAQDYLNFCAECGLSSTMTGSGSAYFLPFADKFDAKRAVKLLRQQGFATHLVQSVSFGVK